MVVKILEYGKPPTHGDWVAAKENRDSAAVCAAVMLNGGCLPRAQAEAARPVAYDNEMRRLEAVLVGCEPT